MKPIDFLRKPDKTAGGFTLGDSQENIVPWGVEKRQTRPYCKSQQAESCCPLSFPKLMAQPRTRKKEIGKWKRSRHSRTFRILSSTRRERKGITSPSIWSAG